MIVFRKFLPVALGLICVVVGSINVYARTDSKWNYSLEFRVTRCFKMKNVKIICDGDRIDDVINAELEVSATDANGKKFVYGYGKSIEGNLCDEHLSKIRKLIKGQEQVCITGDGENQLDSGEVYARWQELETRRGKVRW